VPKQATDRDHIHPLTQQKTGAGVSEVVEADLPQARPAEGRFKPPLDQHISPLGLSIRAGKYEVQLALWAGQAPRLESAKQPLGHFNTGEMSLYIDHRSDFCGA
jgi:hypothetical protein